MGHYCAVIYTVALRYDYVRRAVLRYLQYTKRTYNILSVSYIYHGIYKAYYFSKPPFITIHSNPDYRNQLTFVVLVLMAIVW